MACQTSQSSNITQYEKMNFVLSITPVDSDGKPLGPWPNQEPRGEDTTTVAVDNPQPVSLENLSTASNATEDTHSDTVPTTVGPLVSEPETMPNPAWLKIRCHGIPIKEGKKTRYKCVGYKGEVTFLHWSKFSRHSKSRSGLRSKCAGCVKLSQTMKYPGPRSICNSL